jgi:hypothetical protein
MRRQQLQRNPPVQGHVMREIDLAHASRSQTGDHFVVTEALPRSQRIATLGHDRLITVPLRAF